MSVPDFVRNGVAAPTAPVPTWRPIDTAPMDGTHVLAYSGLGGVVCEVVFNTQTQRWWSYSAGYDADDLTHWMPLPMPPAGASAR